MPAAVRRPPLPASPQVLSRSALLAEAAEDRERSARSNLSAQVHAAVPRAYERSIPKVVGDSVTTVAVPIYQRHQSLPSDIGLPELPREHQQCGRRQGRSTVVMINRHQAPAASGRERQSATGRPNHVQ